MTESAKKLSANGKKIKAYVVFTGKYFGYNYSVTFSCEKADDFKDVYNMAKVFFSKHITDPFEAEREYNTITSDSDKYPILKNGVPSVIIGSTIKEFAPVVFGFGNISSNYSLYLNGEKWSVFGSIYSSNAKNTQFRYMSQGISSVMTLYNIILNNNSSEMHFRRASYFGYIPISKPVTNNMLVDYINSNGSKKSGIKCEDNLDYLDHIATNLIKVDNGKACYPTYGNVTNKKTQTKKGVASLATKKGLDINELLSSTYIPVKISPISPDYDNDGIPNEFDPKSEEVFDNRFELVNKYNADPYDLFPDYVLHGKEKYGESSDDYYDLLYDKWYNSEYQIAKRANNTEKMSEIKKKYLGIESGEHIISLLGLLFGNVSGINLERFLDKSVEYNKVENLGSRVADLAIGDSRGGRFGFYTCMNLFFQCAEDTVIQGCTNKALSSKTTYKTLLPGSTIWAFSGSDFENVIKNSPKTIEELDILLGLSDYNTSIVSDNISCYEKNGKIYYSAKVRYYILDLYDYDVV